MVTLKESDIPNNCPECFNQDLRISFYQKHKYGRFYDRTTNDISHRIQCHKCGSTIYPVDWTDDIERIFGYYQKMAIPEKASIRFTKLFYILILLLLALVAAGVYLFVSGAMGS